jgi:hypothetical protein
LAHAARWFAFLGERNRDARPRRRWSSDRFFKDHARHDRTEQTDRGARCRIEVRAHGGLGLGLAIVEFLVRQQSGTVKAESEGAGKGATFTVEFPLVSHEVVSHVRPVSVFPSETTKTLDRLELIGDLKLKNRRILIVEDDLDNQELLKQCLNGTARKLAPSARLHQP